jgi:hypothetical protein
MNSENEARRFGSCGAWSWGWCGVNVDVDMDCGAGAGVEEEVGVGVGVGESTVVEEEWSVVGRGADENLGR